MIDPDIDRWTAAWRAGAPPIADLARLAQRERRILAAWIALDWTAAAGLIAFAAWLWFADGTPVMRLAAIGIVLLTLAALAFTVVNWRGKLVGSRASAADFLALAVVRSRARLRYIRFGGWLLAADVVVIAGVAMIELRDEGMDRLLDMLAPATLAVAAAAAILIGWGRRERRRAERLAAMQRALQSNGDGTHD